MEIKTFIYCDISSQNIEKSSKLIDTFRKSVKTIQIPENIFGILITHEKWPFLENSIDCIVNNLNLHSVNSLEEILIKYNESLKPDGCFIGNKLIDSSKHIRS